MIPTPDTEFADRLQELCEEYPTLGGATICGLLLMQVRMIQDAAKEQAEQRPTIPEGWRELAVGEQFRHTDKFWQAFDCAWELVPLAFIEQVYDRGRHAVCIRRLE